MAGMNSGLYLNKQQVAFIIHPKQNNKYPNINKKCRGIVRIRNKTMYLLHSYLRVPFSGKVLFSFKRLKISAKKPWKTSSSAASNFSPFFFSPRLALSFSSSLCHSSSKKHLPPLKNSLPSPLKYPSTNTSQKTPVLLQLPTSNQHPAPPCQWICSNRKYTLLTNSQNISMPRVKLSLAPQFHHLLLWPPTTRRHVALWDCDTWQNRLPERWGPKWGSTIMLFNILK